MDGREAPRSIAAKALLASKRRAPKAYKLARMTSELSPIMPPELALACSQRGSPPPGSCVASLTSDCAMSLACSGAIKASRVT